MKQIVWYGCAGLGALLIITLLALYQFGMWAVLFPASLGVQRNAVEQSKSFTDSSNLAMVNYMQDYQRLDTEIQKNPSSAPMYSGQQTSDLQAICATQATMAQGTVSPLITGFIAQHGGCR